MSLNTCSDDRLRIRASKLPNLKTPQPPPPANGQEKGIRLGRARQGVRGGEEDPLWPGDEGGNLSKRTKNLAPLMLQQDTDS